MTSLYEQYRPSVWTDVVGQDKKENDFGSQTR